MKSYVEFWLGVIFILLGFVFFYLDKPIEGCMGNVLGVILLCTASVLKRIDE